MRRSNIFAIITLLIVLLFLTYYIYKKNIDKKKLQEAQPVPIPEINLIEPTEKESSIFFEYNQETGEVDEKKTDNFSNNENEYTSSKTR